MGFQVMVEPPVLRDKEREGYANRYAERREIPMLYVHALKCLPAGCSKVGYRTAKWCSAIMLSVKSKYRHLNHPVQLVLEDAISLLDFA